MGTEYEVLVQHRDTGLTVPYAGPAGIGILLAHLSERFGWERVQESGHLIELKRPKQSITLEPGGQFEMSGAPLKTLREVQAELDEHVEELAALASEYPVDFHWVGANPWQGVEAIQWMPKARYSIMKRYLPTRGSLALNMMGLTCTVQANLDYTSEADFAKKMRLSAGVGALATAMFANSPITAGSRSGYKSFRAQIWTDMDPDRCGLPRFVFETDGGYAEYVNWVLDVPLFFVKRGGEYLDLAGKGTFRMLMETGVEGHRAQDGDWDLHMSTVFPDVRARPHLEMRTCDCVPPEMIPSCPALWKGLLYDEDSADAAWDLVKGLSYTDRVLLTHEVPRHALATPRPNGAGTVGDLCRDLVQIARLGLERQAAEGLGEVGDAEFLNPLTAVVTSGVTPADRTLERG